MGSGSASRDRGESAAVPPSFRCPQCGAANSEVVAGEELEVESIDVEEQRCTAHG
jgi:Zn finger protein HypA/HybF involved in hydrogenase expression